MDRTEFEQMDPNKLLDKITDLNKRLFKINQRSPMFGQLQNIIAEAQAVYQESLAVARYDAQNEERDSIINIGDISSEVYTPNYDDNHTVLDTVVEMYTQRTKK
tara:strand:- start:510 stop:821 length:312 start_codon:yes stop_codon:yes gene_type:complete